MVAIATAHTLALVALDQYLFQGLVLHSVYDVRRQTNLAQLALLLVVYHTVVIGNESFANFTVFFLFNLALYDFDCIGQYLFLVFVGQDQVVDVAVGKLEEDVCDRCLTALLEISSIAIYDGCFFILWSVD